MKESDFPTGTKFFVKGFDVPVAVLPDGKAASWYGGTPTQWDAAYLRFAMVESNEGLVEVPYAEFARLVAESERAIVEKRKLFEADVASKPLSVADEKSFDPATDAILKSARDRALSKPSNKGDFLFAMRGPSGGPDPDAD